MRAEVIIEGSRYTWWYACGECHGAVNYKAQKCNCGAELNWQGVLMEQTRRNTGEQTEPAE